MLYTVNVEIFAQYIFSRISRMFSNARKYDVSENLNHYMLNRNRYKMCENMSTRKWHIWLDARKFSCAKIATFTVAQVPFCKKNNKHSPKLELISHSPKALTVFTLV